MEGHLGLEQWIIVTLRKSVFIFVLNRFVSFFGSHLEERFASNRSVAKLGNHFYILGPPIWEI